MQSCKNRAGYIGKYVSRSLTEYSQEILAGKNAFHGNVPMLVRAEIRKRLAMVKIKKHIQEEISHLELRLYEPDS